VQIRLLKWIDSVVGGLVAAVLPAASSRAVAVPQRLLVIRPGGIGDAVLLVPALLALKERFPEATITVLAERRNGSAFILCPVVDHLLLYDTPAGIARAILGGYDVVIDTEQWHRLSAVVAWASRALVTIGFATNNRKRLFSHSVAYSHNDYETLSFFNLLAPLAIGPPASLSIPFLVVPAAAVARADALLAPFAGARLVTIFPGASIAERRWGAERFRRVAERLAKEGIKVVVLGGKDDAVDGEVVVQQAEGLNLAGKTTLAESAAVIARSALLLSGDSGVLHLAVGLGVPTVSLFGPGIEAKWGPKGEGDRVLNHRLPCSPCTRFGTTPPCPCQARCLSEITVEEVVVTVTEMLARKHA
jgi:heptosyltransferase II